MKNSFKYRLSFLVAVTVVLSVVVTSLLLKELIEPTFNSIVERMIGAAVISFCLIMLFLYFSIKKLIKPITNELNEQTAKRKKAEESMKIAMCTAKKATIAKSTFLANMSHELRTPLNAICGFSEIIMEELLGKNPSKYKEYAVHIHKSGQHLLTIISNILDLSRIEAGKEMLSKSDVNLSTIINKSIDALQEEFKKENITVTTELVDCTFVADKAKIKQIIFNILSNSIKFSPNETISITTQKKEAFVLLAIKDTGIGMTEEGLKTAINPFGQIKENNVIVEGTGLGVPLAKQLVELHNGSMTMKVN